MTSQIATKSGFATLNGTKIFYTSSNSQHDKSIVMVHAGICDHRMWEAQVKHFAQKYHVLTFDIHSFGQSGFPTASFALHDDIIALLDYLKIDSVWFMAASLGGAITFDVALMHPERVKGLIMVAPAIAGFRYEGEPHPLKAKINEAEENDNLDLLNELEIQMWVDGNGRKPGDLDPEMRNLVLEMNLIALKSDDSFWEHEVEIDPPALERLSEIDMPFLMIYGDLDVRASLERVDIITEKIIGAKKVLIENTAHLPNMEEPQRFNQIVDDFLGSI